jgi:phosphatidylserine/phosphatidylglycerophosphate/cardiolipin synthase-like enzyme
VSVLEALRALELTERERPADLARVRLVATLPGGLREIASTRDVARNVVTGALRELLVIGYSIRDPGLRALIIERGLAGVRVTVVGDRLDGGATGLWRDWPRQAGELIALEDVEALPDSPSRMHGKVLVADRQRMLIGSANFTSGGLARNLEFGVLVDGSAADDVCRQVEALKSEGWIREVGSIR